MGLLLPPDVYQEAGDGAFLLALPGHEVGYGLRVLTEVRQATQRQVVGVTS